jgi:hypothetical protein
MVVTWCFSPVLSDVITSINIYVDDRDKMMLFFYSCTIIYVFHAEHPKLNSKTAVDQ